MIPIVILILLRAAMILIVIVRIVLLIAIVVADNVCEAMAFPELVVHAGDLDRVPERAAAPFVKGRLVAATVEGVAAWRARGDAVQLAVLAPRELGIYPVHLGVDTWWVLSGWEMRRRRDNAGLMSLGW